MKTSTYINKHWSLLAKVAFLILLSITYFDASAQISFRNPTYSTGVGPASEFTVFNSLADDGSNPVKIPAAGEEELSANFSATLFRPVGTSTQGFVSIQLGNTSNDWLGAELNAAERITVDNSLWTPARDINGNASSSYEQLRVTGTFLISGSLVATYNGLYAVYYSSGMSPVYSRPVIMHVLPKDPSKDLMFGYLPCGGNVICGDQCVPYGTRPETIKGRVMAAQRQVFLDYLDLCTRRGISPWTSNYMENEWAKWQYSYDNHNWTDAGGADFGTDYSPPPCTRTTYYRRVSTHIVKHWFYGNQTKYWYTSNIVKITPTAPIPTLAQNNVTSCGGSITVGASTNSAIVSYNWWVPYAGWVISDGSQPSFSTFNNNTSFVTSNNTNIVITPPSNVAPGNYQIAVSANGRCGEQSTDALVNVTVNFTGTNAPLNGYFSLIDGSSSCNPRYNLRTQPVEGAISYEAMLSNGAWASGRHDLNTGEIVFFDIVGPQYGISAQIFANGACGRSAPYDVPVDYLAGGSSQYPCDGQFPVEQLSNEQQSEVYPNPAASSFTIKARSDASVGYLYNSQGKILRIISLDKSGKVVDISGLPNGLYNLIIESPTRKRYKQHVVIEH